MAVLRVFSRSHQYMNTHLHLHDDDDDDDDDEDEDFYTSLSFSSTHCSHHHHYKRCPVTYWHILMLFVLLLHCVCNVHAMRQCESAYLTCQNGGTIARDQCKPRMNVCNNDFDPFTKCRCRLGFTGFDCSIAKSPVSCPSFSAPVHVPEFMHPRAVVRSVCRMHEFSLFSVAPLKLRDVRIELIVDALQNSIRFKMYGRSKDFTTSSCSSVLELAGCEASECYEETSVHSNRRRIVCAKKKCMSCRDNGHRDKQECPMLLGNIGQFARSTLPMAMEFDDESTGENKHELDAGVTLDIPKLGRFEIRLTCDVGACVKLGTRTSSSMPLLERELRIHVADESEHIQDEHRGERHIFEFYVSILLAGFVLLCVASGVVRVHILLLLPPPSLKLQNTDDAEDEAGDHDNKTHRSSSLIERNVRWSNMEFNIAPSTNRLLALAIRTRSFLSRISFSNLFSNSNNNDICSRDNVSNDNNNMSQRSSCEDAVSSSIITPRRILHPLSGYVCAGDLVALIGCSGSGKSTLMRLIVSSASGVSNRRELAFVTQNDFSLVALTVLETVMFAARTRLPSSMPIASIEQAVARALHEVALVDVASLLVSALSGGQRRRLMIATELVGNPRVLVLDEPLSGLDSTSAAIVLRALRSRATQRRCAIIISLHQPSKSVWNEFDRLIVMGRGGKRVFDGVMNDVMPFFSRFGGVVGEGTNAWEYVLDTISRGDTFAMHNAFENSVTNSNIKQFIHHLENSEKISNDDDENQLHLSRNQRLPWHRQVALLCERSFRHTARDPRVLFGYNALNVIAAVGTGLLYYQLNNRFSGAINRSGFFTVSTMFTWLISLVSIDVFISERILFRRERRADCYNGSAYFASKLLIDVVPLRVLPSFVFGSIVYYMVGLQPHISNFFWFNFILMLHNVAAGAFCFLLSCACETAGKAHMIAIVIFLFNLSYGTTLVHQAPPSSSFSPMALLRLLSPFRYAIQALHANEFNDLWLYIDPPGLGVVVEMSGAQWIRKIGMSHEYFLFDIFVLMMCSVAMFTAAFCVLMWREHHEHTRCKGEQVDAAAAAAATSSSSSSSSNTV